MSLFIYSARAGWIPTFGDLTYNLAVQYGWVYGLSLTEMEIVHGAFRKCNPNGRQYYCDVQDNNWMLLIFL